MQHVLQHTTLTYLKTPWGGEMGLHPCSSLCSNQLHTRGNGGGSWAVIQVRMMKEERLVAEGALEEARSKEMEQRSRAEALKQELDLQRAQVQRHLTQVCHLAKHCCCPSYA